MYRNQQLLNQDIMKKIFGKIEIETMLKKMRGEKLKQTEKNYLSRAIRPKLIAAALIADAKILPDIQRRQKKDDSFILYNLSLYKYPLLTRQIKKGRKIPIEELIIKILIEYPKARYIEAIPFLLSKNTIDCFLLFDLTAKYDIKNKIGYLLETAHMLHKLPHSLLKLLHYLEKNKCKEQGFLISGDREFLEKTSPPRIKNWHLLGRFFDADFKKLAEVYL